MLFSHATDVFIGSAVGGMSDALAASHLVEVGRWHSIIMAAVVVLCRNLFLPTTPCSSKTTFHSSKAGRYFTVYDDDGRTLYTVCSGARHKIITIASGGQLEKIV